MGKKVWGGLILSSAVGKQVRVVYCGTLKDFMARTGLGRNYISDTGNLDELEAALANPGVFLIREKEYSGEFRELKDNE